MKKLLVLILLVLVTLVCNVSADAEVELTVSGGEGGTLVILTGIKPLDKEEPLSYEAIMRLVGAADTVEHYTLGGTHIIGFNTAAKLITVIVFKPDGTPYLVKQYSTSP
jgi:hypothetical protein